MKVLIADDQKLARTILKKAIDSFGYQVVEAVDGDAAWEILTGSDPPQIAILDWVMPGKTGVEICAECQRKGMLVYRILLTAKQGNDDIMYALDQGAHDFQKKPVSKGLLKSRIAVGERLIETIQELRRSERLAAVGNLVAGVAHHYNNLNLPILMYTSSLQKNPDLAPDVRKKVEKIEKIARRAGALTEKLMSIARNKAETRVVMDFNKIVQDALEIKSMDFDKNLISVETDLQPLAPVQVAESDFHHVIMNIIGNACDALIEAPEKKITIKTGMHKGQVFLSITDTGCGIAYDKLQQIFSPFFSEKGEFAAPDSPMSKVKGAGIGLYATKTIVNEHGGEIKVKSQLNEGTTFTVWLPVAEVNQKDSRKLMQ